MSDALQAAARAAGLLDSDLLQIAKPELTAEAALDDLRLRFPDAFTRMRPANDLTPKARARLLGTIPPRPTPKRLVADMTSAEAAAFEREVTGYDARLMRYAEDRRRLQSDVGEL